MKNKFFKICTAFFATCGLVFGLSACVVLSTSSGSQGSQSSKDSTLHSSSVASSDSSVISHEHNYVKKIVSPTCTEQGYTLYTCACGESYKNAYVDALDHDFKNYVSDNNATFESDGTKTAWCERDGCLESDTIPDVGTQKTKRILFKTLTVDGNNVRGEVANNVESFSFDDEIVLLNGVSFLLAKDENGEEPYAENTVSLVSGENVIYVLEKVNGAQTAVYKVVLCRMLGYTVSFVIEGGPAIESQTVEENACVEAPVCTRAGYTLAWDYDFTQPVTGNITVSGAWIPNTDTPYLVEYYWQNVEDDAYTLHETENCTGTTDTTANAEIKTFAYFTPTEQTVSGAINGDGSLVLRVYYNRNTYSVRGETSDFGTIDKIGVYKYGTQLTATATLTLGYDVCWYSGEELVSKDTVFSFIVQADVVATFVLKAEMENFTFTATTTSCVITGVKDKTITKAILPDCVTAIAENAFQGCAELQYVIIPESVISVGANAFAECDKTKIYCVAKIQPADWNENWNVSNRFVLWDCYNNGLEEDGNIYTGWH